MQPLDRAIAEFAVRAAQNERDNATFMGAVDSGRLEAPPGR